MAVFFIGVKLSVYTDRKLVELGLHRLYIDHTSNFRKLVKMLMSLAYLPVDDVETAFHELWHNNDLNITESRARFIYSVYSIFSS